jgi:hypothetical protein
VLAAAGFSEYAFLLDFAAEALQSSLKRFVIANFDLRHQ